MEHPAGKCDVFKKKNNTLNVNFINCFCKALLGQREVSV